MKTPMLSYIGLPPFRIQGGGSQLGFRQRRACFCLIAVEVGILGLAVTTEQCRADTFGRGNQAFDIEFVTIGDPGNPPDTAGIPSPAGAVDYVYRISKYEISRGIIEKANSLGDLGITLIDMTNFGGNGPAQPATGISWFEAAKFVNWLNSSSGYPQAYKFNKGVFELWDANDAGYDPANRFRNRLSHFFLPSVDEWYKAAFYDGQAGVYYHFATGSNDPPTPVASGTAAGTAVYHQRAPAETARAGGLSPYGTMAQGANVWEWEETEYDLVNDSPQARRGLRSGSWMTDANHQSASYRNPFAPSTENMFYSFGFRVAGIVHPSVKGDFNGNGVLDAADIDMLAGEMDDRSLDLTGDGIVNQDDRAVWVHELANTWLGDSNLDGEFNSEDLNAVFQAGKYESDVEAGWSEGDWTADRRFTTADLVAAFRENGFELGPLDAVGVVPEPSAVVLVTFGIIAGLRVIRGSRYRLSCLSGGTAMARRRPRPKRRTQATFALSSAAALGARMSGVRQRTSNQKAVNNRHSPAILRPRSANRLTVLVIGIGALTFAGVTSCGSFADTVLRWEPDVELNGLRHGARGVWRDALWGFSFISGDTWAYNGQEFLSGGKMPGGQKAMVSLFTDDGIYVLAPNRSRDVVTADILYSPDGFQDYQLQLSIVSTTNGQPFAAGQDHSLVDLGAGNLMFFEYSDEARIYYSPDAGKNWNLLLQPDPVAIRHWHGAFYDSEYGKLYAMSGDSNAQSSIMVTDDIFGEHGLINDPALWRTRWGLKDPQRSTLDASWLLKPDGIDRSQLTRTVDMEIEGDYIYWGEDTGRLSGQSVFRAHRQTMEVERVGDGGIIGAPWRFLKTSDGRFLFLTASVHWLGSILPGNDKYVHIYEFNEDRSDYHEVARFPTQYEAYHGAQAYGFTEAFDRLWINGYHITDRNFDLVGQLNEVVLGDFDGDQRLSLVDIDLLSAAVREGNERPVFDLDLDGQVVDQDRVIWVESLMNTSFGDANLDGRFDSDDLVQVFRAGRYEDDVPQNATWSTGDWGGDGEFDSADLLLAYRRGRYQRDANDLVGVTPEPSGTLPTVLALLVCWTACKRNPTGGGRGSGWRAG